MSAPFATETLMSFDGTFAAKTHVYFPDRYRALESIFSNSQLKISVQGSNLSYAPLSFSSTASAVNMKHWNHVLAFDTERGEIEVEAGMTLGELSRITLPKKWYLLVQPGHPSISIGGCVASDVHGKNQFVDGNFKEQMISLKLFHPQKGVIQCSREENASVFDLTCGGWGLTGVILSVRLRLGRVRAPYIVQKVTEVPDIFELPEVLNDGIDQNDLLYSWHDFNSKKNWGHGFVVSGKFQDEKSFEPDVPTTFRGLSSTDRGSLRLNWMTKNFVQLLNTAYSRKEMLHSQPFETPLMDFLFPVRNKTIYFKLFGAKGFYETQVLIPQSQFIEVLRELRSRLSSSDLAVTLASCKLFRGQRQRMRFFGDGIVLAMNFPANQAAREFLSWWDSQVIERGLLPNIVKDSRLSEKVVAACYPDFEKWRADIRAWDEKRIFQTELSKRLRL